MSYQINPTFAAGNILTASQLNILRDNIEYLYGLAAGANIPFTGEMLTGSGESRRWTFRHRSRYLHYQMRQMNGTSDELDIRMGPSNTIVYTDATNRSAPYTWSGYLDLEATAFLPTIGDFYTLYVEYDFTSGNDFRIDYFIESDSTVL